jgi:metal-responsive CopG/Arc/MetJ family transcriptional regulator
MSAKRGRVAVTISIPPAVAKEYDRIARATAKNRSELFRDMFDTYRRARDEELFNELQRYGAKKARERGIRTERDVERLVFEDR